MTYAMLISLFFVGLEFFTAFYSNIPGEMDALKYLFVGLEGHHNLVAVHVAFYHTGHSRGLGFFSTRIHARTKKCS